MHIYMRLSEGEWLPCSSDNLFIPKPFENLHRTECFVLLAWHVVCGFDLENLEFFEYGLFRSGLAETIIRFDHLVGRFGHFTK